MNFVRPRHRSLLTRAAVGAAALVALAACGKTSSSSSSSSATSGSSGASSSSSDPGTSFSAANVSGLGMVVVDGKGRTVYALTSGSNKNVPCDDASGCTKVWPDLPLPNGTSSATAGSGLQASMMGTMKLSDGETYPTYNGYLMYEYVGDSGSGQNHGEGIKSFGGTWYALSPSGQLVTSSSSGSGGAGSSSSSSNNSGY